MLGGPAGGPCSSWTAEWRAGDGVDREPRAADERAADRADPDPAGLSVPGTGRHARRWRLWLRGWIRLWSRDDPRGSAGTRSAPGGLLCAGRWRVPAAGGWCLYDRGRPGGSSGRFLPGHVLPLAARRRRGRWPAPLWQLRACWLAAQRDDSSPRLLRTWAQPAGWIPRTRRYMCRRNPPRSPPSPHLPADSLPRPGHRTRSRAHTGSASGTIPPDDSLIVPLRGDDIVGEAGRKVGPLDKGVEVTLHHLPLCTHTASPSPRSEAPPNIGR